MKNETLLSKLNRLPDDLKREAMDFIEFLTEKNEKKIHTPSGKGRTYGSGRGLFIIPDDFDEPLEDFKE